jgi:TRAP-type transport system small permease protein
MNFYFESLINFVGKITKISKILILLMMIILTSCIIANVFLRFVFAKSLPWAIETAQYSFIWITFLGTAVALKEKSHAKIDLLLNNFSGIMRTTVILFNNIIVFLLSLFFIVIGGKQFITVMDVYWNYINSLSIGYVYIAIPICGILMLFVSLASIIELFIKNK